MMNTIKLNQNILVTVTRKEGVFKSIPIWNKVMLGLKGDLSEMLNLTKELQEVKKIVNYDMNKRGYALKDINVKIEFVEVG